MSGHKPPCRKRFSKRQSWGSTVNPRTLNKLPYSPPYSWHLFMLLSVLSLPWSQESSSDHMQISQAKLVNLLQRIFVFHSVSPAVTQLEFSPWTSSSQK